MLSPFTSIRLCPKQSDTSCPVIKINRSLEKICSGDGFQEKNIALTIPESDSHILSISTEFRMCCLPYLS